MKWVMWTTIAIVVFVVDVNSVSTNSEFEEFVAYNQNFEHNETYERNYAKRVNYDGDQVLRIYKHNDSVNDLVEQYHEHGCT